jgi:hypothetical protein
MPNAPVRGASTDDDTLHIKWDKMSTDAEMGGSEIIYYSVYKEGGDGQPITQTSGNSYLYHKSEHSHTEPSAAFRIAATNIYGTGEQSDVSEDIEFGSVPKKLVALTSQNIDPDNKRATIVWDDPGETDLDYEFQILDKNSNSYVDASVDGNSIMGDDQNLSNNWGREFDCQTLIDNFGYQKGDTIAFRVRASNDVGASEWSYPDPDDMTATSFNMLIL